MFILLFGVDIC